MLQFATTLTTDVQPVRKRKLLRCKPSIPGWQLSVYYRSLYKPGSYQQLVCLLVLIFLLGLTVVDGYVLADSDIFDHPSGV